MKFYVAGEDRDGIGELFFTQQTIAVGVEGAFGDGAIGYERAELLHGFCDGVMDRVLVEAHGDGVVGVVLDPVEGWVFAAERCVDDGGSDGESVLAVGEEDDGGATIEVDGDKGLVDSVVAPVP